MPIEFRCHQCQKLLRTKDDTAGKQAKCPQCGTVLTVPPLGTEAPPEGLHAAPPVVETGNPYQSPVTRTAVASEEPAGINPTKIDFSDMLGRAWKILKANLGISIAASLILMIANAGVSMVTNLALSAADIRDPLVQGLLAYVINLLPNTFFTVGGMIFFLNIARGKPADLADLFKGGPRLIPATIVLVLYTLAVYVGIFLLIVPGVIVAFMFSQAMLLTIDRNTGVTESFGLSRKLTAGNKFTLFVLYLVAGFGGILFVVFTCGLGLFVLAPYMFILLVTVYLAMTGERTADQLAA